MNDEKKTLTPAERMYQSHLRNVAKYQRQNPDKMRRKQQRYIQKRRDDPLRHQEFLQKRREYYKSVICVKNQAKPDDSEEIA